MIFILNVKYVNQDFIRLDYGKVNKINIRFALIIAKQLGLWKMILLHEVVQIVIIFTTGYTIYLDS